jgi:hypothetical protein
LDLLPPRISDPALLALLGEILAVGPDAADAAKLRLRVVGPTFSWQALADLAFAQDVIYR